MITKTGQSIINSEQGMHKTALFYGALTGAERTDNLTEAERALFKEKYGLNPEANLAYRNSIRGIVGDWSGGAIGGAIGHQARKLKRIQAFPLAAAAIPTMSLVTGSFTGARLATNKYSKERAWELANKKGVQVPTLMDSVL